MVQTLLDILFERAQRQGDQTAYIFLNNQGEETTLTYAELHQQAGGIAARLQQLGAQGTSVLLLHPPGLEYIAAFFGCLYAGAIAVPAYPPRLNRRLVRLQALAADAQSHIAMTTQQSISRLEQRQLPALDELKLRWLASDTPPDGLVDAWDRPVLTERSLAFLQYTSGSTSTPKGVMVSHGNLMHNLALIEQRFGHTAASRGVIWLPPYHDMGLIGGILQPLFCGFPVTLMAPTTFLQNPLAWLQAISRYRATTSGGPNFAYDLCLRTIRPEQREDLDLSSWQVAFTGAEPVRAQTLANFAAAFQPHGFRAEAWYPCYGLAEATLLVSGGPRAIPLIQRVDSQALAQNQVQPAREGAQSHAFVGCGQSAQDQTLLIVDTERLTECPAGQVGEIWLSGPSIAQGYWNRTEESAATFNAYRSDNGTGPYLRTGDLGFLLEGQLYLTGRCKDLIIIRGRNHYPQDIELTAGQCHPALHGNSGAAFAVMDGDEEHLVIVQEVQRHTEAGQASALRAAIRQAVVEQHELQPSTIVLIRAGALPKTSSGKVQRAACRMLFLTGALPSIGELSPQGPGEAGAEPEHPRQTGWAGMEPELESLVSAIQALAAIALRQEPAALDPQQPLSSRGLDSLSAIELLHAIEREFGVCLALEELLRGASIVELARQVLAAAPAGAPAPLTLMETAPASGELGLTHGQRALWFLHQLAPQSRAYTIARAALIHGELDLTALERALQTLVARHAALRATFPLRAGDPSQAIGERAELALVHNDATRWSQEQLSEWLRREAHRPFDLECGPLLRVAVLRRAERQHILLLAVHHIVADFWSLALLVTELGATYSHLRAGRPEPAVTPDDYVRAIGRQISQLDGTQEARLWEYWRQKLAGALPTLNLQTDRPRPPTQSFQGAAATLQLGAELTQELRELSRQHESTLYITLLAAFQVLLSRYTGQTDILVGSPVAERNRAELRQLVGYFINPVVLRADLAGNPPFSRFLAQVRASVLEALAHQEYPFARLVEQLQRERDPSRSPLVQAMFVLQKAPLFAPPELAGFALGEGGTRLQLGDLSLESIAIEQQTAQLDLTLAAAEGPQGLSLSLQYNSDLFDPPTIERMLRHLQRLLKGICETPEQPIAALPLLPPTEQQQILVRWNATERPYESGLGIHQLFEAQVARTPDAIAAICDSEQISYAELDRRANQLAHALRALELGAQALIGLCTERSITMLVGLLGILKAGAAYVPLDPMYPRERLEFMLQDAQLRVLVTQAQFAQLLGHPGLTTLCLDTGWEQIARQPSHPPQGLFSARQLAYVIYTSGSTGNPKGVQIEHRSVVNFLNAMARTPGLASDDLLLSVTTLAFDIAALELFLPLSVGARLVLASRAVASDGIRLAALLQSSGCSCMQATPATWRLLLEAGWQGSRALKILCGGEALPRDLADQLLERCAELWNLYGPTETTIWSAVCRVEPGAGSVPIGRPIDNTQIYLLDAWHNPVPLGVAGELYIGGDGVARGYLNRPELTAQRFLPNPWSADPTARIYHTGDLARFLPDGSIEFLGRVDHQVKVRGFRIELSEIEVRLGQHPALRSSVVVAQDWGSPGEKRLVAYVVPRQASAPTPQELRAFLREKLPEYMLPSAFVVLEALPLTPNGKINRLALPSPNGEAKQAAYVAPASAIQRTIAKIWQAVLQREQVGIHDNFFDLGGHSLLMGRVNLQLRTALQREISIVELFQYPTIDSLARYLSGEAAPSLAGQAPAPRPPRSADGIAVIGMAGRFPGARNVTEFWRNLQDGIESIAFFSDEELRDSGVPEELLADPKFVRAGAVLDEIAAFDAAFFGYSPHEAEILDPQQRIFLECAWETLEHSGYDAERYPGKIGVYASAGLNFYLLNNLQGNHRRMQTLDGYQAFLGNDKDFIPTRVSYKLNLRGPSVNVQTACSSSLVAIHMACQSLLSGECDMALAGGIAISLPQKAGYLYQERGIASPDGHCRAFDTQARGTVRGNGAGVVLLKPLADAIAAGDTIYAVVRGSAINNDGSLKAGYTAPSVQGQAEVIAAALASAQIDPESIGYVEAHGTGTEVGDPIEIAALTQAFRAHSPKVGFCAVGSAKTNIGHLDTAAGVAGFIKTVLALHHQAIPPSLHFSSPNPAIDFEHSPFYVNTKLAPWSAGALRRAGLSSFGVGGTNAHVILEEAPAPQRAAAGRPWQVLLLSAKSATALEQASQNLASYLKEHQELELADVAYTLQVGRRVFSQRRALICASREEAIAALETLDPKRVLSATQELKQRNVAFMFTGQGAQYVDMARELYVGEPLFRASLDRCAELLHPALGLDLRQIIYPEPGLADHARQQLQQTWLAQPALFAVEYALAQLWMAWGIQPQALIGHSIGEYVAACLADVFRLEDVLALVAARGRLMQQLPGGAMLAVPLPEAQAQALLGPELSLAAINSSAMSVVSGSAEAIEALEQRLRGQGLQARRLHTSHAFHSAMMEPILAPFAELVSRVPLNAPRLPCISNLTGRLLTAEQATDPGYWAQHLRQPVRFADGLSCLAEHADVLIEVGPGRTLSALASAHPSRQPGQVVLSSLRHPQDQQPDSAVLMGAVARLWLAGVQLDWASFSAYERRMRVPLPTYPFERQRYWVEPDQLPSQANTQQRSGRRAALDDWFYMPSWKRSALPRAASRGAEPGRWLLLADSVGLAEQIGAQLEQAGHSVIMAHPGTAYAQHTEQRYSLSPGRPEDYAALLTAIAAPGRPLTIMHLWGVASSGAIRVDLAAYDQAAEDHFYSLLYLAQALGFAGSAEQVRLIAVTTNLHEVTGAERVDPLKALQLGPLQTIPLEYPQLRCRSIDVTLPAPGEAGLDALAATVIAECEGQDAEPAVAYRGPYRWVPIVERVRLAALEISAPRLREAGVYMITGGLGGIGLTLASHLARSVRARLVLIGRSELPAQADWERWLAHHGERHPISRTIRQLQELERAGAQLLVLRADVADLEQMRAALAETLGRWGRIDGVIHAAGVPGGGMIQHRSREEAERVMAAKVKGTLILHQLLGQQPLDFLLLCSSINAVVGRIGQVDYSAANAFLDAFVHAHRAMPTLAINWETWREVGMAAALAQPELPSSAPTAAIAHPLFERCLFQDASAVVFESVLSLRNDWALREHWVLGRATLPGTAYLEMARAAYEAHTGQPARELRDVSFLTPLTVAQDEEREVRTLLRRQGEGYSFVMLSRSSPLSTEWLEHASGMVGAGEQAPPRQHDLAALKQRCAEEQITLPLEQAQLGEFRLQRVAEGAAPEHHPALAGTLRISDERGGEPRSMEFGPRWNTLRWVALGRHEGLAHFELAECFQQDLEDYALHPALLDFAASFLRLFRSQGSYLPLSYRRLVLTRSLPRSFYCHARLLDERQPDGPTLRFRLTLLDEAGLELLDIEEFAVIKLGDPHKVGAARSVAFPALGGTRQPAGSSSLASLEQNLSQGLSPAEGVQVFERILASKLSRVVVSTVDLQERIEQGRAENVGALAQSSAQVLQPKARHARPNLLTPYAEPSSQLEQALAKIWQEVLGLDQVGIHDNFYDLGGDSLLITQIHARFSERLSYDLSVATMMQYPTIADLSEHLSLAERRSAVPSFELVQARASKQKAARQQRREKLSRQTRS